MALHPQTARFLDLLAAWGSSAENLPTVADMRGGHARREPYRGECRELPQVADLTVPGPGGEIPVRLYRPEPSGTGPLPALVYFHGGGWVIGDIDSVDATCRELAAGAGCVVLNVGYRLAPEHPFPAAVEDAWAVTADVVARPERYGADPRTVAVAGDSAGGNLAAVTALRARDEGLPLAHQLLVYPVTDAAFDTASYAAYGRGHGLDAETMIRFTDLYAAGADRRDPLLAPLRAPDLGGLAPATVVTAECDVLRDEGDAYATRLAEAGVDVAHRCYAGMVHSFFLLPEIFDDGLRAREFAIGRLRAAFATATERGSAA
ncbi:alpha/beta hydrolase [Actinomadura craniellae]|uniref:Alpha/beta hydrolase n=1 Tax=Actinomadura craniellae TaxID=2231787 RepID=A0A365GWC6_9ACTN|nr:alpha/beta hydrolase [Actinomadura craniellae]RAY11119.1 alpha/beta hydrolase [Actinomadura craniellae]